MNKIERIKGEKMAIAFYDMFIFPLRISV